MRYDNVRIICLRQLYRPTYVLLMRHVSVCLSARFRLLPVATRQVAKHTVWPTWPDRTANVTAINTVYHGEGSVLNIPVAPLLDEEERLNEDGYTAR
jgi:hypothetical protein